MLSANGRGKVNIVVLTFASQTCLLHGIRMVLLPWRTFTFHLWGDFDCSSINYRVSLVIFHKYWQNNIFHNIHMNMITFFLWQGLLLCLEFISGHPAQSWEFPFFTYVCQSYYCLWETQLVLKNMRMAHQHLINHRFFTLPSFSYWLNISH